MQARSVDLTTPERPIPIQETPESVPGNTAQLQSQMASQPVIQCALHLGLRVLAEWKD